MKVIKLVGITLLGLVLSVSLVAQSNNGIDMLRLGEYELAKQFFNESAGQDKAKSLYYLGEIAWEEGNLSEAKTKYAEALSADPESWYAQLGVAKADLKNDPKEAKKALENIYKKNKKDVALIVEVAKAFFDNGMTEDADKAIAEARKANVKSPLIYILLGDVEMQKGKTGEAAKQYDQAINFDKQNVLALIKAGKVYENINANVASDYLRRASEVDPGNRLVNRTLAKIYSTNGYHARAIKLYSDYFMQDSFNLDDIRNFAISLYFNQNYREARDILNLGIEKDKDNFVFNRLLMYVYKELGETDNGLNTANHFFALRANQEEGGYLAKDYLTYGHLLTAAGDTDKALVAFDKAVEMDPENANLYKELASSLYDEKKYEIAAGFYKKFIDTVGDEAAASSDYMQMGRSYQQAGNVLMRDSSEVEVNKGKELLGLADKAYEKVVEKTPDSYLGYYMRGGVNAVLDPEFDGSMAKEQYEKSLNVINAAGEMDKRQSTIQVIYEYLTYYYYFNYEKTKNADLKDLATDYANKTLELNPDKEQVKQVLEAMQ